jgi:hypothetical protein
MIFRSLALALLVCIATSARAAPTPQESAQLAIRALDLQTTLPAEPPAPYSLWDWKLPEGVGEIILWTIVILGCAVVLWSIRDSLPFVDRSRRIEAIDRGGAAPTGDSMVEAQLEADDLAQAGRYVEAMHVLLLQSLSEMRNRLDVKFADSLTSREILRLSRLSDRARVALTTIIRDVEWTYFGEKGADLHDYQTCRHNFETLKLALAERMAA